MKWLQSAVIILFSVFFQVRDFNFGPTFPMIHNASIKHLQTSEDKQSLEVQCQWIQSLICLQLLRAALRGERFGWNLRSLHANVSACICLRLVKGVCSWTYKKCFKVGMAFQGFILNLLQSLGYSRALTLQSLTDGVSVKFKSSSCWAPSLAVSGKICQPPADCCECPVGLHWFPTTITFVAVVFVKNSWVR